MAEIVDVLNPPALIYMIYRLESQAHDVLGFSDFRKMVIGALSFAAKFDPAKAASLFLEDQPFTDEETPNWTWVTRCCQTDLLAFREEESDRWQSFDAALIQCFWKSKAILYGRLMSCYRTQQPHNRVGQIIGYQLHQLYTARGLHELPECINDARDRFVDWMGFQWNTWEFTLPFDTRELQENGITREQFPMTPNDTWSRGMFRVQPEGYWAPHDDKEFAIAKKIYWHNGKTELCRKYLDEFQGTLTEYSNSVVLDEPTHAKEIEAEPNLEQEEIGLN